MTSGSRAMASRRAARGWSNASGRKRPGVFSTAANGRSSRRCSYETSLEPRDGMADRPRARRHLHGADGMGSCPEAHRVKTAGDLLVEAVDAYLPHAMGCNAETCATCDLVINRLRLAYKIWQNSDYTAVSDTA